MKSKFFAMLCASLSIFMIASTDFAFAQGMPGAGQQQQVKEDYTDEELKAFIEANKSAVQVQQQAEQKMIQAIEDTDMDVNRFNEIATAQQDPQAEAEASEEEMATFNEAAQKVMTVQRETQSEIAAAVESEGMEFNEYRQIMMAYQSSPKVQQQITKLLEAEQGPDPQN